MKRDTSIRRPPAAKLAVLLAILLLAQQLLNLPGRMQLEVAFKNALHAPWFFLVTVLVWRLLRDTRHLSFERSLAAGALVCLVLAGLTEFAQFFTGRNASLRDLMRDLAGGAAALFAIAGYHKWKSAAWEGGRAAVHFLLAGALLVAGFTPVGQTLWTYHQRDAAAPALVEFDDPSHPMLKNLLGDWRIISGVEDWPGLGDRRAAEITLPSGTKYPGLRLREPYPYWGQYRWLVIEAFVRDERPIPVTVRVETRRDRGMRSTVETEIRGGENLLKIPVESLIPGGAAAALHPVEQLLLFSSPEHGGRRFYLAGLRLEK